MRKRKPRLDQRRQPNDKFTPAQVIAALEMSAGIHMGAAQKLKCARSTIGYYVKRYPEVKEALDNILEERLDLAEGVIVKRMTDESNPTQQVSCAQFLLRFKGQERGYVTDRHRPVPLALPALKSLNDVLDANQIVVEQAAAGNITPSEAKQMCELLDLRVRAITQIELADRLDEVGRRLKEMGMPKLN